MNIAFITHYDLTKQSKRPSHLIGNFGSSYYMAKSLEQQGENITYLSPLAENHDFRAKLFNRFYKTIKLKNYSYWAEQSASKNYARQIEEKIATIRPDILVCPHANLIAYLHTDIPLVLWTDSLYIGLLDVFPQGKPCSPSIKDLIQIDKLATQNCNLLVFSSDWAAQIAIKQYNVNPAKVKVVPTGANLEFAPNFQEVQQNILSKSFEVCKLLFVGVDWNRKGGDIALSIAQRLNQLNLKTELYLVGCQPPENEVLPDYVHSIGFVDRSTRSGQEKIENLYHESHFLVLPSRSDCTPAVLREAGAFGLPCITTNIGGIPSLIRENYNGKMFNLTADISECCEYIIRLFTSQELYQEISLKSYQEYADRLNWKTAGKSVRDLLIDLL